mmetsp:Transcript_23001/g.46225  ORF Transcript_23001/g.46225 Transcript_23001/m.46225 type:complete len:202 (+) Transcript_23001:380-985(+)
MHAVRHRRRLRLRVLRQLDGSVQRRPGPVAERDRPLHRRGRVPACAGWRGAAVAAPCVAGAGGVRPRLHHLHARPLRVPPRLRRRIQIRTGGRGRRRRGSSEHRPARLPVRHPHRPWRRRHDGAERGAVRHDRASCGEFDHSHVRAEPDLVRRVICALRRQPLCLDRRQDLVLACPDELQRLRHRVGGRHRGGPCGVPLLY